MQHADSGVGAWTLGRNLDLDGRGGLPTLTALIGSSRSLCSAQLGTRRCRTAPAGTAAADASGALWAVAAAAGWASPGAPIPVWQ